MSKKTKTHHYERLVFNLHKEEIAHVLEQEENIVVDEREKMEMDNTFSEVDPREHDFSLKEDCFSSGGGYVCEDIPILSNFESEDEEAKKFGGITNKFQLLEETFGTVIGLGEKIFSPKYCGRTTKAVSAQYARPHF